MALGVGLQLRQSQSLIMTPQLMQSIRLLQLTHIELDRFIDEEIEKNPLLERVRADDAGSDPEPPPQPSEPQDMTLLSSAADIAGTLDTSLENVFPDDPGTGETLDPNLAAQWKSAAGSGDGSSGDGDFDLESLAPAKPTLRDHVGQQIALSFADPVERFVANELADHLDETGYCLADCREIALRLGIPQSVVERVRIACQTFEPTGLFARDLAECLGLQLAARNRLDPAMRALLTRLDLLARRDFATLTRLCGVEEADLIDMLAEIRALDPKPGLGFEGGTAEIVAPDVLVRAAADGSWAIELNAEVLPRVLVDQTYYTRISSHARSAADKAFVSDCLQTANWLTRSLDQRAKTILKVASEIVRQQDAFLVHGVRHLRPLNLRTVADGIGMHESTVSRVTTNKFMLTPRGVFELRYFFTAAIASAEGGAAHSAEAVRDRIRELIDAEASDAVLSDDAIVDCLRETGVDIARRTVAKYREGMNIPSSVERRREKRVRARLSA